LIVVIICLVLLVEIKLGKNIIYRDLKPENVMLNCLSLDTQVLTRRGFQSVQTIQSNDEIASLSSDGSLIFVSKWIKHTMPIEKRQMVHMKSHNNHCEFHVTDNHRLYVSQQQQQQQQQHPQDKFKSKRFTTMYASDVVKLSNQQRSKTYLKRNALNTNIDLTISDVLPHFMSNNQSQQQQQKQKQKQKQKQHPERLIQSQLSFQQRRSRVLQPHNENVQQQHHQFKKSSFDINPNIVKIHPHQQTCETASHEYEPNAPTVQQVIHRLSQQQHDDITPINALI
jgi:hypothetical protein